MCNKIDERRTCDYCDYPWCEADLPPTPDRCTQELADIQKGFQAFLDRNSSDD